MPKQIREIIQEIGGKTTVEYDDNSLVQFNIADTVTGKVDPLTGRIANITAGGRSAVADLGLAGFRNMQRGARRWAGIYVDQTAFTGYTWRMRMELPIPAASLKSVRFAVASHGTANVALSAAIATSGNFSLLNPDGAWQYTGFNGSDWQSFEAATISRRLQRLPEEVWSDWVTVSPVARSDGGTYAIVHLSVYHAGANICTIGNNVADSPFQAGAEPLLKYVTAFQSGDFTTTNRAGFAGSSAPACGPMVAIEYLSNTSKAIHTVAHYTDSIGQGYGLAAYRGKGPVVDACASITAAGVVIASPAMSCCPGEMSDGTMRRFVKHINSGAGIPSIAIFRPYSRNDGGNLDKAYGNTYTFLETCKKYGIVPILETGIYESDTTANNAYMVTVNAFVRSLAASMGIQYIEQEDVFNAGNAATYLGDGIHPNDAGQALMVPRFVTAISAVL
jgi:hypothetical protein